MNKMNLKRAEEIIMEDIRKTTQFKLAMRRAQEEADAKYEAEMKELEALFDDQQLEEVSELDIFMNLEKVKEQYEDVEYVDINSAEDWINENLDASQVLGVEYSGSKDLVSILSEIFNSSVINTNITVLNMLDIHYGSQYQRDIEARIAKIKRRLDKSLGEDVVAHLKKRKVYEAYRLLLDLANDYISLDPLIKDSKKVIFYLSKRDMFKNMKERGIKGDAGDKLTILTELGLLRTITNDELKSSVLYRMEKYKSNRHYKNHVSFYEVVDLKPAVVRHIKDKMAEGKNAIKKEMNAVRRVNTYGEDEVFNNIHVQMDAAEVMAEIEANYNDILTISEELLTAQGMYSIEELADAYRRHHPDLNTYQTKQKILDYMPRLLNEGKVSKVRVNAKSRKQLMIDNKYISNSSIYTDMTNHTYMNQIANKGEEFRAIEAYDYLISNQGRVYSLKHAKFIKLWRNTKIRVRDGKNTIVLDVQELMEKYF